MDITILTSQGWEDSKEASLICVMCWHEVKVGGVVDPSQGVAWALGLATAPVSSKLPQALREEKCMFSIEPWPWPLSQEALRSEERLNQTLNLEQHN